MLLLTITIYQILLSTILKNILGVNKFCRFSPTCSEFAKKSILKDGIIRGGYMSFVRLMKCQPFVNL